MFRTIGEHLPPPAGLKPPALWGTRERLEQLFGGRVSQVRTERRTYVFTYRSPEHFLEIFTSFHGPVHEAFAALDARGQAALCSS